MKGARRYGTIVEWSDEDQCCREGRPLPWRHLKECRTEAVEAGS
jgi:hypothetical protein